MRPSLIMTGNKMYQMTVKASRKHSKIIFRDSWMILLAPLDGLKKALNLKCENKMFFPNLFNTKANMFVQLDHLPPIEDYIPNGMKPEKKKQMIKWHAENKNTPFSLFKALPEYGNNDTQILLEAIVEIRRLLIQITGGYDVLLKGCTIAGVAMQIYRHMFLQKDLLSIVPEFGYERVDNASDKAIKYMEWRAKEDNVHIQHAGNGREKQIGNWKVDGFIAKQNKVIEFLGNIYNEISLCKAKFKDAISMVVPVALNLIQLHQTANCIELIMKKHWFA